MVVALSLFPITCAVLGVILAVFHPAGEKGNQLSVHPTEPTNVGVIDKCPALQGHNVALGH